MAGAFVLIMAGLGSALVGGVTDSGSLDAGDYQAINAAYTGSAGESAAAGDVDISRDFDRGQLELQTKTQAAQTIKALKSLTKKTQAYSDELKKNQWVLPVAGYQLTARFGQRSSLWSSGVHTGLDFAGPSGSTLVAISAGTVKSAGYEGSYGNRTVMTLLDGTEIWYCHQSRITVKAGDSVSPGQVVGYTGSTGNVTGPHLHLEVRPGGGSPVDPIPVLIQHGVRP